MKISKDVKHTTEENNSAISVKNFLVSNRNFLFLKASAKLLAHAACLLIIFSDPIFVA